MGALDQLRSYNFQRKIKRTKWKPSAIISEKKLIAMKKKKKKCNLPVCIHLLVPSFYRFHDFVSYVRGAYGLDDVVAFAFLHCDDSGRCQYLIEIS